MSLRDKILIFYLLNGVYITEMCILWVIYVFQLDIIYKCDYSSESKGIRPIFLNEPSPLLCILRALIFCA